MAATTTTAAEPATDARMASLPEWIQKNYSNIGKSFECLAVDEDTLQCAFVLDLGIEAESKSVNGGRTLLDSIEGNKPHMLRWPFPIMLLKDADRKTIKIRADLFPFERFGSPPSSSIITKHTPLAIPWDGIDESRKDYHIMLSSFEIKMYRSSGMRDFVGVELYSGGYDNKRISKRTQQHHCPSTKEVVIHAPTSSDAKTSRIEQRQTHHTIERDTNWHDSCGIQMRSPPKLLGSGWGPRLAHFQWKAFEKHMNKNFVSSSHKPDDYVFLVTDVDSKMTQHRIGDGSRSTEQMFTDTAIALMAGDIHWWKAAITEWFDERNFNTEKQTKMAADFTAAKIPSQAIQPLYTNTDGHIVILHVPVIFQHYVAYLKAKIPQPDIFTNITEFGLLLEMGSGGANVAMGAPPRIEVIIHASYFPIPSEMPILDLPPLDVITYTDAMKLFNSKYNKHNKPRSMMLATTAATATVPVAAVAAAAADAAAVAAVIHVPTAYEPSTTGGRIQVPVADYSNDDDDEE